VPRVPGGFATFKDYRLSRPIAPAPNAGAGAASTWGRWPGTLLVVFVVLGATAVFMKEGLGAIATTGVAMGAVSSANTTVGDGATMRAVAGTGDVIGAVPEVEVKADVSVADLETEMKLYVRSRHSVNAHATDSPCSHLSCLDSSSSASTCRNVGTQWPPSRAPCVHAPCVHRRAHRVHECKPRHRRPLPNVTRVSKRL
jgi:hypothetical protein